MIGKNSYPLSWPESWPRIVSHQRRDSNFKRAYSSTSRTHSMEESTSFILHELNLFGVRRGDVIISTNVELRMDGLPYSGRRAPADPGAAVYFKLKGRECVLACDKWLKAEDNLWAIGKDIEAQRGRLRWGVGNVEQAFRGYMAIPEKTGGVSWWDILGVTINATEEQVRDAYKSKAKEVHPDVAGGDAEKMTRLNEAYRMATAQRAQRVHQ